MSGKSKKAHLFKVGDRAIVLDVRSGKLVNTGFVVKVTATHIVFEGPTNEPEAMPTSRWAYRRKGTRWVEMKKDHYELEPSR